MHTEKPQTIILFFFSLAIDAAAVAVFVALYTQNKHSELCVSSELWECLATSTWRLFSTSFPLFKVHTRCDASDYSKYGTYGHHVTTILIFSRAITEILCLHSVDSCSKLCVCVRTFFVLLNCSAVTVVAFVSFFGTEKICHLVSWAARVRFYCFLLAIAFVHFLVEKPFLILLLTVSFIGRINALFTNYQLRAVCSTNTITVDTQVNWLFSVCCCFFFLCCCHHSLFSPCFCFSNSKQIKRLLKRTYSAMANGRAFQWKRNRKPAATKRLLHAILFYFIRDQTIFWRRAQVIQYVKWPCLQRAHVICSLRNCSHEK